ncbi:hypothetical protein OAI46_00515 [Alphaproteobacteria bacterium]|nr:hypothetical protein [Alphaproteobacteria bacterium]MDB4106598.1 hypothetical protein [bacterium]MDC0147339.1 hypothetical protein [Alphaproteobacteria bacterium]
MIRRILSRAVSQDEWPIWVLPIAMVAGFVLASSLIYWVYFGPGLSALGGQNYQPSQDTQALRIEVGGTLFAIPASYTRNTASRRTPLSDEIGLHALLPDFETYTSDNQAAFLRADDASPLLLITIHALNHDLPVIRRFEALYAPFIVSETGTVETDLQRFEFRQDTPYRHQEIFRALPTGSLADRAKAALFVCDKLEKPSPNCQSRFPLGRTAEVSYSFKRSRLGDWQNIDNGVKDLIKSFRTAARIQN